MKKVILMLISLLLLSTIVNAQYRINKTKYDFRTYSYQVGDPYNTGVAGIASLLIPGLGQMLSGEVGRGLGFLGGDLVCGVVYVVGYVSVLTDIDSGGTGSGGSGAMLAGGIGMLVVDIWSIIDAVRVAKVNNLAFRDKNKTSYSLKLQSLIMPRNNVSTANIVPVGLTFKVVF